MRIHSPVYEYEYVGLKPGYNSGHVPRPLNRASYILSHLNTHLEGKLVHGHLVKKTLCIPATHRFTFVSNYLKNDLINKNETMNAKRIGQP